MSAPPLPFPHLCHERNFVYLYVILILPQVVVVTGIRFCVLPGQPSSPLAQKSTPSRIVWSPWLPLQLEPNDVPASGCSVLVVMKSRSGVPVTVMAREPSLYLPGGSYVNLYLPTQMSPAPLHVTASPQSTPPLA